MFKYVITATVMPIEDTIVLVYKEVIIITLIVSIKNISFLQLKLIRQEFQIYKYSKNSTL